MAYIQDTEDGDYVVVNDCDDYSDYDKEEAVC